MATTALTIVHSDTTVARTVTQEEAYTALLAEIFAPTVYAPKIKPERKLRAV